jgi:hypothetical protein
VTSRTYYIADLATKGSGTGAESVLKGADKACAETATATGSLAPAGTYVAWISSRSRDALGRLSAAHGGVTPRGWKRVDGRPVVDQIPSGSNAHIFYPVSITETGQAPPHVWVWTATDALSQHDSTRDCMDWTTNSSSSFSIVGLPAAGGDNWSGGVAAPCDQALPLYCMQVDHVVPVTVPSPPANAKRAFVSPPFSPASGLAGADTLCANDAQSAGLTGTFRALLATTTATAASRFHTTNDRPYVRPDGVVLAATDGDLFLATPNTLAPINVDLHGNFSDGSIYTGAPGPSQLGTQTCANWSDGTAASQAVFGTANYTGLNAFSGLTDACNRQGSVYCLQD